MPYGPTSPNWQRHLIREEAKRKKAQLERDLQDLEEIKKIWEGMVKDQDKILEE